MVVPMKKIFLVVQDKHQEESLKLLRKIGVVHLERKAVSSDALTSLFARKARADAALKILLSYCKDEKDSEKEGREEQKENVAENSDIINQVHKLMEERKVLLEALAHYKKEQSRLEEWGFFEPDDLSYLAEDGNLKSYLYKLPRRVFEKLSSDVEYIMLKEEKDFVMLFVLYQDIPGRQPFNPGEFSIREVESSVSNVLEKIAAVDGQLSTLAEYRQFVEAEVEAILIEIEFESARAKLNLVEDIPVESNLSWLTGFVPKDDLGLIKRAASENCWALFSEDPTPEDATPTKLKNSKFVNLLSPITGFLNISPGYDEPDISGWFLFFLTIFFGIIFGDGLYGVLFVLISVIGLLKTAKKGSPIGLKLLLLLGMSNLIWGTLTCSWLGLEPHEIPLFLQQISLPLISNVTAAISEYHAGIVQQNLMIVCFSLALVHLSIGHIISITRNKGLRILADIGSIMMLLGMYGLVLHLIASNEHRQIPLVFECVYLLGIGFVLVFVFTYYEGSVGKSAIGGAKNIISMILGVANVFSDTMSYIRLWAVGLAGASIASTVASMAGPMLGNAVAAIFGILILVLGHGLNLVLNLLAVLVHGVRLNTLEFSGHVGLTWSGTSYSPFKEKDKK